MVLRIVSSPLLSLIPRALRVLRVLPAGDHVTIEAGPARCVADVSGGEDPRASGGRFILVG
jgi:hypothetical protein